MSLRSKLAKNLSFKKKGGGNMYLLQFFNMAYVSADEQSLAIGLLISFLFYLNYRKLQQEIEKEEMLESFLKAS